MITVWLSLVLLCSLGQVNAAYAPLRSYEGATFFDGWSFYGNVDNTTWGNVTYLNEADAFARELVYVNDAGNAIIKVDNTTTLSDGPGVINRDSVRLTTNDAYGLGTLIVIDAVHIPYGCSVWPSFWSYGRQVEWPGAGEIDLIEGINGMTFNQVALHTTPGCIKLAEASVQSGSTIEGDCSTNRGCIVAERKPNSYGPAFAAAGGGVFALQMEATGFYVWFFSRPDLPANLRNPSPTSVLDIESWGLPTAAYPPNECVFADFFQPQSFILLTTLCGVWAGSPSLYSETCPGTCFASNILGDGSNYANAYWEVQYVRAYRNDELLSDDPPSSSGGPVVTETVWVSPAETVTVIADSRGAGSSPPSSAGSFAIIPSALVSLLLLASALFQAP
ncbi:glycoside hydrolase family 16 protein [Coprinopsis marcescibilis]|uniref:Glycoside hydrolase family 16 protein n=1 Tax=Coprinopsis marcescibilis TaxID=230819 RepID=A0A5C3KWU7_COPMA|nr:glycoside hydrolase family 16 protein [Coprinopsis marcescibilis]